MPILFLEIDELFKIIKEFSPTEIALSPEFRILTLLIITSLSIKSIPSLPDWLIFVFTISTLLDMSISIASILEFSILILSNLILSTYTM